MSPVFARILVAAAWEPELERFRALARDDSGAGGPSAWEPAFGGCDLEVEPIGIGLVDTTAGVTRSIARLAPSTVVLLGTCGAAPSSGLRIGDVVVGTSVRLVNPAVVEERAAMPYASEAVPLDPPMIAALVAAGAREATIVNTLGDHDGRRAGGEAGGARAGRAPGGVRRRARVSDGGRHARPVRGRPRHREHRRRERARRVARESRRGVGPSSGGRVGGDASERQNVHHTALAGVIVSPRMPTSFAL